MGKSYRLDDSYTPPEKPATQEYQYPPPIFYSNGISRKYDCDSQFNDQKCHLEKTHQGLHEDSHGNCWSTADSDWYYRMMNIDVQG